MVRRIRCIFRSILGRWTCEIVRCFICGNSRNFPIQFDGRRFMDSSHIVSIVFGIGTIIVCIVSALFMSIGSICWWFILCTWSDIKLLCDEPISSAFHIRNLNW